MWLRKRIETATPGRGFVDLTPAIARFVDDSGCRLGSCRLFLQHTSASLCITENADPRVHADLERFAQRLAPDGDPLFAHDDEGPDDMPAHVRTLYAGCELTVPVEHRRLLLGTWQGIYLWEHRRAPHRRSIVATLHGER